MPDIPNIKSYITTSSYIGYCPNTNRFFGKDRCPIKHVCNYIHMPVMSIIKFVLSLPQEVLDNLVAEAEKDDYTKMKENLQERHNRLWNELEQVRREMHELRRGKSRNQKGGNDYAS